MENCNEINETHESKNGSNSIENNTFKNVIIENYLPYILLIALLGITYYIRSNFFLIPFERDEGIYAYFGKLALEGKIPYKDFYEVKFPGIFYAYATIIKLFGYSVKNLHFGFTVINLLNIILIFFNSKKLSNSTTGIISATIFSILSISPNLSGYTIQAEHLVAFFLSLALFLYLNFSNKTKFLSYLLLGLFISLSIMIKTNAIFFALLGFILIGLDIKRGIEKFSFKRIALNILGYALGGLIPIITFFAIIYVKGSFKEMIYYTIEIPGKYVSAVQTNQAWMFFKASFSAVMENHKIYWYLSFISIIFCFTKIVDLKKKIFICSIFILSILMVTPGFYFHGHYFILTLPGIAILAGLASENISKLMEKWLGRFSKQIIVLLFFAYTLLHLNTLKQFYFHPNYFKILRSTYGSNPFPEAMEIGKWLNLKLKKEDQFALVGSEPELFVYTNRYSISRHAYFTAIVNNIPEHKGWQREFVNDIQRNKPKFFIYFNNPISLLVQPNTDNFVFKWSNDYIKEYYKIVGIVDMISPNETRYIWEADLTKYVPVSKSLIYVYERK